MKKIFSILAIALVAAFAEPEGKIVDVELLSGTHQRAKLIGIENDTVSLGGYIQNKFTVVKIAKGQFKKIVDEQGNDLLNADNAKGSPTKKEPAAKEPVAVKESVKPASSSSVTATSSAVKEAPSSSSIVESSSSESSSSSVVSSSSANTPSANTPKPEIKTVLVAYNAEGIEQNIADQITALTARLLMESGEKPQIIRKTDIPNCNDNICIQSALASHGFNSIYFGEVAQNTRTDSLSINLTHVLYEDSLPLLHRSSFNVSRESALGDAITNNKLKNQLLDAQGKDIVKSKKDRAYIHVETDPDGATISRTNKDAICKSPCTFVTTDTAKFTLHAYWNVDRHLWGASTSIIPLIGDTTHISLKLKRVTPEIRIQTFPEGANVYKAQAPITKRSKVIAQTPEKIPVYEMGMDSLLIRKAGYRDTLVSFFVAPVSQIDLSIDLQKLTDFDEIEKQNKWLHDKKMQTLGEAFIGGSIGTALIGALFMYLAHLDYNDADDIKKELKIPGAVKGENYKNKVDRNHKLVKQGDNKATAGGVLLGTAAALLGVGIYFVF
ncbi:MAG: hypothetical protein IKS96_08970 [Fibrobacter sp.]|nr:hypothetical protein [Fibrobacter sp.]